MPSSTRQKRETLQSTARTKTRIISKSIIIIIISKTEKTHPSSSKSRSKTRMKKKHSFAKKKKRGRETRVVAHLCCFPREEDHRRLSRDDKGDVNDDDDVDIRRGKKYPVLKKCRFRSAKKKGKKNRGDFFLFYPKP